MYLQKRVDDARRRLRNQEARLAHSRAALNRLLLDYYGIRERPGDTYTRGARRYRLTEVVVLQDRVVFRGRQLMAGSLADRVETIHERGL